MKAGYRRNRDILLDGLPALGFDGLAPADGAFYLYADVEPVHRRLAALLPRPAAPRRDRGDARRRFRPDAGASALRLSYAGAESGMVEAMKRMKAFLASR